MYCPQCGQFIPDDSTFCPLCGARTEPETPGTQQPPGSPDGFMFDNEPPGKQEIKPISQEQRSAGPPQMQPQNRSFLPYSSRDIIIWAALAMIGAGAVAWWPIGWSITTPFLWLTAGLVILAGLFEGIGRRVFGALGLLGSLGLLAGIFFSAASEYTTYWGNVAYYGWEVDTPYLVIALVGGILLLVLGGQRLFGKRGRLLGRIFGGKEGPGMEPSGKPPAKTIASSIIALVLVAIFIGFPLYSYFAVPAFPGAGEGLDDGSLGEFPTVTRTPVSTTTVPTSPPVTFTSTPTRTVVVSTPQGTSSPPNARFSASTYSGTAPLTIYFRDDSTGLPTTWSWDFGDGSSATIQNPVHTYSNPGTYSVRLSVTGPGGSSTSYPEVIQVSGTTPSSVIAAFSATPGGGLIPLTVNFIDMSSGSPVSWSWDFGDGETSTLQNPVHTYTSPGYYTARLTVRSSSGATSTATAPAPIIAGAPITTVTTTVVTQVPTTVSATGSAPVASFTYTPDLGPVPLMVTFHDTSIGTPATWYWDFGDGSTSTLKNPVHTYQDVGDFYVLLTVTNSAGTSMTEQGPISVFYRL